MHNAVGEVRQFEYHALFRLIYRECRVFRRLELAPCKRFVQPPQVAVPVLVELCDILSLALAFPSLALREVEVLYADNPIVQITKAFHLCFDSASRRDCSLPTRLLLFLFFAKWRGRRAEFLFTKY